MYFYHPIAKWQHGSDMQSGKLSPPQYSTNNRYRDVFPKKESDASLSYEDSLAQTDVAIDAIHKNVKSDACSFQDSQAIPKPVQHISLDGKMFTTLSDGKITEDQRKSTAISSVHGVKRIDGYENADTRSPSMNEESNGRLFVQLLID